jgi:hypothetical protein
MEGKNDRYTSDDDQDDRGNPRHGDVDRYKKCDKAGQEEKKRSMKEEGNDIHNRVQIETPQAVVEE